MTQKAEATAPQTDGKGPRASTDLLGIAYLATTAVVMTAWICGLIWIGLGVVKWIAF